MPVQRKIHFSSNKNRNDAIFVHNIFRLMHILIKSSIKRILNVDFKLGIPLTLLIGSLPSRHE